MLYVSVRGSRLHVEKLRRSSAVMERIEDMSFRTPGRIYYCCRRFNGRSSVQHKATDPHISRFPDVLDPLDRANAGWPHF